MFIFFYLLAAWALWLVATPFLAIAAIFSAKARSFLFLRMLPFGEQSAPFTKKGVWIHCASFGEARGIKPIVDIVLREKKPLCISVTTASGYDEAIRLYPSASVSVLPFENFLPFWVRPQRTLIVFEAEFWLALFFCAKKRGAIASLFSARIPATKFGRYKLLKPLFRRIFGTIDQICAQSEEDRARFISLGAKNVVTLGNIKRLIVPQTIRHFDKPARLALVLASSHEGEESLVLNAWIKSGVGGRLFIVPRHAERFDAVWQEISAIAEKNRLSAARLGDAQTLGAADITLIDAMGLLIALYEIADIVVLGGAFAPKGGHNPIEPATFGCKVISGENIFHQKALFAEISGVIFSSSERLAESLKQALNAPKAQLKGAVDRTAFEMAVLSVV
jgi:3-deoxy-D-manno-octulosonic-acid transferase